MYKRVNVKYNKEGNGSTGYDVAIVVLGETPYAEGEGDARMKQGLN